MAAAKALFFALCPECGSEILFRRPPRLEQVVVCSSCESTLEVIDDDPIELGWIFDDGDDDDAMDQFADQIVEDDYFADDSNW